MAAIFISKVICKAYRLNHQIKSNIDLSSPLPPAEINHQLNLS